ncbi:MAG: DUF6116 family protein [Pseudomonadota bacterium]
MIIKPVRRFLEQRRFPSLLLIAAGLLGINFMIADPLPFIDELLMLIATLLIGSMRKRKPAHDADSDPNPNPGDAP